MSKPNKNAKTPSVQKNNQSTDLLEYDAPSRMIFSKAVELPIPESSMTYKLINILTHNEDGTVGDLIVPTVPGTKLHPKQPKFDDGADHFVGGTFSFGVQENTSLETKKVTGHSMSLSLYDKTDPANGLTGPTKAQKAWVDAFNAMCEHIKTYLIEHKDDDDIGLYELTHASLAKLNPLYWKKEKGKVVAGTGPVLYPKLKTSGKKSGNKIISLFYSDFDEPLDPMALIGQFCHVDADIQIEAIYIGGGKVTLQVKLYEASNITILERGGGGMKRLHTARPISKPAVAEEKEAPRIVKKVTSATKHADVDEDEDEAPAPAPVKVVKKAAPPPEVDDEDEPAPAPVKKVVKKPAPPEEDDDDEPAPAPVKKVVRRVVKKAAAPEDDE